MAQTLPPAAEQAGTYGTPYVIPRKKKKKHSGRRKRKTIWSKTLPSVGLNIVSMGSIGKLDYFRDYENIEVKVFMI